MIWDIYFTAILGMGLIRGEGGFWFFPFSVYEGYEIPKVFTVCSDGNACCTYLVYFLVRLKSVESKKWE